MPIVMPGKGGWWGEICISFILYIFLITCFSILPVILVHSFLTRLFVFYLIVLSELLVCMNDRETLFYCIVYIYVLCSCCNFMQSTHIDNKAFVFCISLPRTSRDVLRAGKERVKVFSVTEQPVSC